MQDFLPRIQSSATLRFLTLVALFTIDSLPGGPFMVLEGNRSKKSPSPWMGEGTVMDIVYAYSHPTFDAPGSEDFLYTSALKISVAISLLFLVALGSLFYWKVWRVRHDNPAT